jgi:hypothetical protein
VNALVGVRFGKEIEAAARAHGLEPRFLAAVAAQETGGPGARSGNNIIGDHGHGHGLFQIDDRYHAFALTPAAMDPAQNADYAAGMLSGLLHTYHGDARAALSAYNAGSPNASGTATTWADGATLGYAQSVMRHYASLGGDPTSLVSELQANRGETTLESGALAGLAGGMSAAPGTTALDQTGAVPASPLAMPMSNFQITLPAPSPYPSQYRSYTSISGLDTNGPQQIDAQMTGLIDGGDTSSGGAQGA